MPQSLTVTALRAPIQDQPFDLTATLIESLDCAGLGPLDGDVLAVSSKYAAIAAGRVVNVSDIVPTARALELARRYRMDAAIAQLVIEEAEHIFGGIELGFLLTAKGGVISPNAGLDRSNIPSGKVVLLPQDPFAVAERIRRDLQKRYGRRAGVILTDSWLAPGRYGTTGIAIAVSGFHPLKDERGKQDLFGNPMTVTQIGVADSLASCAQAVMGERNEARPFAVVRGADIELTDAPQSPAELAIPWRRCIYIESLTIGVVSKEAGRDNRRAARGEPLAET